MLSKWGILSIEMQEAYVKDIEQDEVQEKPNDEQYIDAEYVFEDEDEEKDTEPVQQTLV
mgnify:CR=1 FL=1